MYSRRISVVEVICVVTLFSVFMYCALSCRIQDLALFDGCERCDHSKMHENIITLQKENMHERQIQIHDG